MMRIAAIFLTLIATVAGVALAGGTAPGVLSLPTDFRNSMHHYASVDRSDGKTYRLYVTPDTLETWRSQRRLDEGATFAIESFVAAIDADGTVLRDPEGRLVPGQSDFDVHVMVKHTNWPDDGILTTRGLLFGRATDGGSWRMAGFDPRDGSPTAGLNIAECHECHTDHRAEDFLLSRGLLDRYARSGAPAFISFSCAEREICFGTPRED